MTDSTAVPAFAAKGSQRWLQLAVNRAPEIINTPLRVSAGLPQATPIEWVSPLASENFVEYSEERTFDRLGVRLAKRPLNDFWPTGGPRWDGLARTATGDVFLVEAKAHIGEMVSGRSRASQPALEKITESLRAVQREIAPGADEVDWAGTFYQYANRLAHLHLLRVQNEVPAHLVFVYFLNAVDVNGPSERAEYEGATKVIEHYLGIRNSRLSRYVHKLFIDVRDLSDHEKLVISPVATP
jgi:hypothetical protein